MCYPEFFILNLELGGSFFKTNTFKNNMKYLIPTMNYYWTLNKRSSHNIYTYLSTAIILYIEKYDSRKVLLVLQVMFNIFYYLKAIN